MYPFKILCGDSLTELEKIDNNSVDFILTSPPYWNLKDYNNENQIGFNQSYDFYLTKLFEVLDSTINKLKPDRFAAINVGDVTNSIEISSIPKKILKTKYFINSIQSSIITHYESSTNIKLFRHIIWSKGKASYNSRGPYYDNNYYPRFIYPQFNYEHILVFYKKGQAFENTPCKKLSIDSLNRIPKNLFKILSSSIWEVDYEKDSIHDAVMPEEIAVRLIKLFTFSNEIILDPFMGRGTSLKIASALGRKAICIDLNEEYINYFLYNYLKKEIKSETYYELLKYN